MIYLYKSISPQPIENLHNCLDGFYRKMFTNVHKEYAPATFFSEDYLPLITANYRGLNDLLKSLFDNYTGDLLTDEERKQFADVYAANVQIEAICNGDVEPHTYDDIPKPLKAIVLKLYGSEGILWTLISAGEPNREIKVKCKTLKNHFDSFRCTNEFTVCPFCGIEGLLSENEEDYKDDYDHMLPKSIYPFVSINFENLFPICEKCNRKYKLQGDPIFSDGAIPVRRYLYYPYCKCDSHEIVFSVEARNYDLKDMQNWNLLITCNPKENDNKKNSWAELYKIQIRYKGNIAKDSGYWKNELVKKYFKQKKNLVFDISQFKSEVLEAYSNIFMKRNGAAEKCFHEFLLNDQYFEDNVSGTLTFN